MDGDMLEFREMPNGESYDYLAGSRVRPGAELLMSVDGQWIAARYEIAVPQPLKVVLRTPDGHRYPLNRAAMRFRWPRS